MFRYSLIIPLTWALIILDIGDVAIALTNEERVRLKEEAKEMFYHAYNAYMSHAYPADELMPLSCKGRYRDSEPSRGDIDDALGNFSLTLIDTLDTLVVLGDLDEFEHATTLIIRDVSFNHDVVVSVFETNIRVLGGLLGGHIMASYLQERLDRMHWYRGELLTMAKEVGFRLLPAFNTTTGVPHPRINLMHGLKSPKLGVVRETCTACAGTMILEFAALSRLTGEPIFEEKARSAMDYLWQQRHRTSDLMGTVLNIHSGDWIRRDSGVGAGIDSYYEYCLKAYILLGDDSYLERFNKHYTAVMKYISQGPLLLDVHMHRPHTNSRNFMDSLLAFWPGLQVLKGDIKPAIETHEMLYQVMQRHNFLPEAFTTDFKVHWGQHPLRPEFLESTYFLYKATGDPYYLEVGEKVMESLQQYARVPCGFAAVKDVRTGSHEDRMDSFVLAETFKYLYLLFVTKEELLFDVDDFVFTTEAHLLPLSLARLSNISGMSSPHDTILDEDFAHSCPNTHYLFPDSQNFAQSVRQPLKNLVEGVCPNSPTPARRLHASEFQASNSEHQTLIRKMGINVVMLSDGRIQLVHNTAHADTSEDAEEGVLFMQEMIDLSKSQAQQEQRMYSVQYTLPITNTNMALSAGPAQFGLDLRGKSPIEARVVVANPIRACQDLTNEIEMNGRIVVTQRGDCMFVEKARRIQKAGGIAGIVLDNNPDSSSQHSAMFAMSGDGNNDINIPVVFLFSVESKLLLNALMEHPTLRVTLADAHVQGDGYEAESKPQQGEAHVRELDSVESENVSHLDFEIPTGQQVEDTGSHPNILRRRETGVDPEKRVLQLISRLHNLKKIKVDLDQLLTLTQELQEDPSDLSGSSLGEKENRFQRVVDKILGKDRLLEIDQDFQVLLSRLRELVNYHPVVADLGRSRNTIRSLRIMLDSRTEALERGGVMTPNPHYSSEAFHNFMAERNWCPRRPFPVRSNGGL